MRTEQTDESIISENEALLRDPFGILTHLRNDRLFGMEQIEQLELGFVQIGEEGWISFPVCDEKGTPIFKKLKRPPKHPDNQEAYRVVPKGQQATLFPLQYLRYAAGGTIYLCEGEADTVTLRSHGCHAFCGTAGARKFDAEWCEYFIRHKIKKVVVLYDNDRTGKEGSEMVCRVLHANMPELDIQKIVWPQEFKEKGDVTDFIVDGGKDSVTNLLKLVQPYEPMVDPEDDFISSIEKGADHKGILPVQAFHNGVAYFAVSLQRAEGAGLFMISSNRECFPCTTDELRRRGLVASRMPPEGIQGRWDQRQLAAFLSGVETFSLADAHNFLSGKLREYVELSDARFFDCLSLWIIATYFYRLFPAFPYLHITGEYQSGKTKVLQILALLSFNGELLTSTSSPASVVRLVHVNGTTCCLDEVEHLWNAQDEHSRSLQDVLRNGYKRGAVVQKCEPGKKKGQFDVVQYDPYSPKVLGGIERLEQALSSRCIQIVMLRSTNDLLLNKEVEVEAQEWVDLRAILYGAVLCTYANVDAVRRSLQLTDVVGREAELWRPLLTIAKATGNQALFDTILTLAKEVRDVRKSEDEDGDTQKILTCLYGMLEGAESATLPVAEICEALVAQNEELSWLAEEKFKSRRGRWLNEKLKRLGLCKEHSKTKHIDGKKKRCYEIKMSSVQDAAKRYSTSLISPESVTSVTSEGEEPP